MYKIFVMNSSGRQRIMEVNIKMDLQEQGYGSVSWREVAQIRYAEEISYLGVITVGV